MVRTTLKSLRKTAGIAALALGMTGLAGSAQAFDVTLDFAQDAIDNNERALTNPGDLVFSNGMDSVKVTIESTWSGGDSRPYLDGLSGGLPAGLGVCHTGNPPTACAGTTDDNITPGESVKLTFKDATTMDPIQVTIDGITFRNQDHGTTFDGDVLIAEDNDAAVTFMLNNFDPMQSFTGTMFTFSHNTGTPQTSDFYIEALIAHVDDTPGVPEPATLAVFGVGLAGLGAIRRRRTAR